MTMNYSCTIVAKIKWTGYWLFFSKKIKIMILKQFFLFSSGTFIPLKKN